MYVKAAPGLVVRDIDLLDLLPPEGREVPDTGYWQRRLRDGDVVLAEPPTSSPAPAPPASAPPDPPDPDPPEPDKANERRKTTRP